MQFFSNKPKSIPSPSEALPGRSEPIVEPGDHTVLGTPIAGPYPDGFQIAEFALGCFWGEEKTYWQQPGVWTTAVGYQGGSTRNPTYRETGTGKTGHAESVRVVFDPSKISYEDLLKISGRTTTRRRACVRAMTSGLSTGPRSSSATTPRARRPRHRRRCTRRR